MKLIVGLGNPGRKYRKTRHNVGFMFIDAVAADLRLKFRLIKEKKCELAEANIENEKIILMKPLTFMNVSGDAVYAIASFYKIALEDIIVIYDDLDLDVAKMRLRSTGTSGGHKGMQSIIDKMNDNRIKRLRIGISRQVGDATVDHVLSDFSKAEFKEIGEILDQASTIIHDIATQSFDFVMNKYNDNKKGN